MDPEISKRLMADVPEMKAFVMFIKGEVRKLDSISDIKVTDPIQLAVAVAGKTEAIKVLVAILSPLINIQQFSGSDSEDYVV